MPDFNCDVCGESFALSAELLARYPGWTPRFCRNHKGGKASGTSSSGGGARRSGGSGARSGGGGGRRGGGQRSGSAREENLQLSDVLKRYRGGPNDGVFTDGSCSPNPGPGGWGVAWLEGGKLKAQLHGKDPDTTNNRMELMALIEALAMLPIDAEITVYSDSNLCVQTVNQWAAGWERRGWKRKAGPIKNLDLVQRLWALKQARPKVRVEWIAAHTGYLGNELADSLATAWMRSEV